MLGVTLPPRPSPLKPYGCEECGKSYRLISLLNLHKKRHTGEARYRCEDCGKLFTTSGNLKRHQLVHSGEKPYQCDYCGRSFSDPTSKMRHLETHDTDKEHKCPHCDKKFNQVRWGAGPARSLKGDLSMGCSSWLPELSGGGSVSMRCSWESQSGPKRVDYPWDAVWGSWSLERVVYPWGEAWRSERPLQKGSAGIGVAPKVVWGSLHPVCHPQVGNLKAHLKIHIADGPLKCRECGKQFTTSGNIEGEGCGAE